MKEMAAMTKQQKINPLIKAWESLNPYDNQNIAKRIDPLLSRALETNPSITSGTIRIQ